MRTESSRSQIYSHPLALAKMTFQKALKIKDGEIEELILPCCEEEVSPGIKWGSFDSLFTPAFWVSQVWQTEENETQERFRLGNCLKEEVAACLLGGHGIPSEVGNAAFSYLKSEGCFEINGVSRDWLYTTLKMPFKVGRKTVHYRFPKQKADYLHAAFSLFESELVPEENALDLRKWLLKIKGIGPKTASWIVRNWLASDEVAILDIHIYRAGLIAGFFNNEHDVNKNYNEMEEIYLAFAKSIGVRASVLDAVIWKNMKILNKTALRHLSLGQSLKSPQLSILSYTTTNQAPTHSNQLAI